MKASDTGSDRAPNAAARPFIISRTFDAPRDRLWRAHTNREQLQQWFGPKGSTMPRCTLDLRPNGGFHYCLTMPNGQELWGKWNFREIVPPERIVLVQHFSDAAGAVRRSPFGGDWPLRTVATTTFSGQDDRTTLTLRWEPLEASDAECKAFDAGHDSMRQGWTSTLDRLDDFLAKP